MAVKDLVNIDEMAHSPLGASSCSRWSKCPASVRLSKGIPTTTSVYAEEGTKAHEIAAKLLEGNISVDEIDPDVAEAVLVYVDYITKCMGEFKDEKPVLLIEKKFHLKKIHPLLFGTADCVIYYPKRKLLRVIDYKHGQGVAVEAHQNVQLMYYGLGALLELAKPCETVELTIVQPRCSHTDGPIRTYSMEAFDLFEFAADLAEFARKTEDPNAPVLEGSHCKFCPAVPVCPALKAKASLVAKKVFDDELKTLEGEALSQALEIIPALESYISGVHEHAYQLAMKGKVIPGWKLVAKRATRKWTSEEDAIAKIKKLDPKAFKEAFDHSLKGIPAIEKLLGKEKFKKMDSVIVSISTGSTLVPESDKRPELKTATASDVFNDEGSRLLE